MRWLPASFQRTDNGYHMGEDGNSAAPVSMIERVVQIMDAFDGPATLTLAQVVSRTGLPRSSAHRILDQLVGVRWLSRTGNHYRFGLRMLELGALALYKDVLLEAALPVMHDLQAASGQVVHLAVLDGPDIVYLEKIGGRFGVNLPSRVGGRAPAYCTGVGKALLAYAGEDAVETAIGAGLRARTRFTITDPAQLRRELQRIRERGVAFDREEAVRGVGCVAAAIRGAGPGTAALSVCGQIRELSIEQLAPGVRNAALAIWRAVDSAATASAIRTVTAEPPTGNWPPGMLDAWATWSRMADWL